MSEKIPMAFGMGDYIEFDRAYDPVAFQRFYDWMNSELSAPKFFQEAQPCRGADSGWVTGWGYRVMSEYTYTEGFEYDPEMARSSMPHANGKREMMLLVKTYPTAKEILVRPSEARRLR